MLRSAVCGLMHHREPYVMPISVANQNCFGGYGVYVQMRWSRGNIAAYISSSFSNVFIGFTGTLDPLSNIAIEYVSLPPTLQAEEFVHKSSLA